jgi:hypothetical protein
MSINQEWDHYHQQVNRSSLIASGIIMIFLYKEIRDLSESSIILAVKAHGRKSFGVNVFLFRTLKKV